MNTTSSPSPSGRTSPRRVALWIIGAIIIGTLIIIVLYYNLPPETRQQVEERQRIDDSIRDAQSAP